MPDCGAEPWDRRPPPATCDEHMKAGAGVVCPDWDLLLGAWNESGIGVQLRRESVLI